MHPRARRENIARVMDVARRCRLAVLATVAVAVGACAAPTPSSSLPPPWSPVLSPTAVPVVTPFVTPSPSPEPGAGLGCGEPIGRADEIVLVGPDPDGTHAIVVDAVGPDGTRRRLAELDDVATPERVQVSPCGHLAVHSGRDLAVVDLHDPDRRVAVPEAVPIEFDWAFARDGSLTVIDDSWGNVTVFDPRDGTIVHHPWNGDVRTYATAAWDGSGWRAETHPPEGYVYPPERVGIVDRDGTFRRSATLVFDAHGFLWRTSADGAVAWAPPRIDTDRDVLDLYPPDQPPIRLHRLPRERSLESSLWDASGEHLWTVERHGTDVYLARVTGPGQASEVKVAVPIPEGFYVVALDASREVVLVSEPGGGRQPLPLIGLDLASGEATTMAEDLGSALIAGWAAPPALPTGVTPPAPFGEPEAIPVADKPVAPDLPADALAIVTCSASGTAVARPTVRALEDGVHFLVRHPDGSIAGLNVDDGGLIEGYAVVSLAPGTHELDCGEGPGPTPIRIEVLDPSGLYRPDDIECEAGGGTVSSLDGDPVPGPEAVAWLRPQLTLAPGDVVEPAGYPNEAGPRIVVVRDGRVVASFVVKRAGDELAISAVERCEGADVGP